MTSVKSNCLSSKKTRRIGDDAARWSRQAAVYMLGHSSSELVVTVSPGFSSRAVYPNLVNPFIRRSTEVLSASTASTIPVCRHCAVGAIR